MTGILNIDMLLSDILLWALFFLVFAAGFYIRRHAHLREPWRRVFQSRMGMIAFVILSGYIAVALLDSIHFRKVDHRNAPQAVVSLLDEWISPLGQQEEKTYSAPFATHLYNKALVTLPNGEDKRIYPRLRHAGKHLNQSSERYHDIARHIVMGLSVGLLVILPILFFVMIILAHQFKMNMMETVNLVWKGKTDIAWREGIITFTFLVLLVSVILHCALSYHVLGTDKVGRDVLYEAIKSIRTGLIMGTLTTLFMLPFALFLGMLSGYFGGWVDDLIQYLYTTLSSIPGVLLISAAILMLQVYISSHPMLFPTLAERADARLLALCFILGITGWANLCRLLRGETLKLREQEFIQAAKALGVRSFRIILRHVMPNVMPIVLITLVLDFSGLVLAEAVLSYVGVGVDPSTFSWGNMINSSRLELAREPIVWWPLLAALLFMFVLVLSANILSDSVRDALDPRLRESRD